MALGLLLLVSNEPDLIRRAVKDAVLGLDLLGTGSVRVLATGSRQSAISSCQVGAEDQGWVPICRTKQGGHGGPQRPSVIRRLHM